VRTYARADGRTEVAGVTEEAMSETTAGRARPEGQTSGSQQRPPHELREPVTVLDLLDEVAMLRREPTWQQSDRNAKTFVKAGDLRLVLTTMKQGATVKEHRAPGSAVVQTLSGHIRLQMLNQAVDLPAGALVVLETNLPHDVEAVEESAYTITIAWPSGTRADGSRT
jgi:quercetin dioxygenase-like cupin family protein